MAKTYTAQFLREVADNMCSDFTFALIPLNDGMSYRDVRSYEVAEALRQSADAMEREEREKKYEYSVLYCVDDGSEFNDLRHFDTLDDAKDNADVCGYDELKFIRREIGEWEEVRDGD